jgi:RNA recognition motif-containing protein
VNPLESSRLPLSHFHHLGRLFGPFRIDPESEYWVVTPPCHVRSLMVGKKLYVGNLTYRVNSSDLEQLFSQFGSVESAEVISDRDTGRSKGFGFVEMSSDSEAKAAIDGLHDQEVDGRRLTVNEARPREARSGGGSGSFRGGGGYGGGGGSFGGGGSGGRGRSGYDRPRY